MEGQSPLLDWFCCGLQVAEKEIGESDEEESEVEEMDVDLVEKARVGPLNTNDVFPVS